MAKATTKPSQQNLAYFLIFLGFLDTMAACVVIMQLVPRILEIGASPILAGIMMALYGGVQFFSSTYVGKLGDKTDKKKLLLISLVVSSASYFLLGYKSLVTFSIGRIILGGFKHTHLIAQSYLTDIVPASKKGDYFGYFGGGIGLGFIVGPTIAGHMAEWKDGFSSMATFTSVVFLINAGLIWAFLPDSTKKNVAVSKNTNSSNKEAEKENVSVRQMFDILLLQLFAELSVIVYFTNFVGILTNKYALAPKNLGYMVSVISIIGMVMAMATGTINRLAGKLLLPVSMTLLFASLLTVSFLPPYWVLVAGLFFMFGSLALLRSVWPSLLTSRVSADKASSAVGMSNSVMAISSMMAPILAGIATETVGDANGAAVLAATLSSVGALATLWFPYSGKASKKAKTS